MLGFRNSVFSLYPRLYPHPSLATQQAVGGVRIARSAWPQRKHLLALGRSVNPSKPTNPTNRPQGACRQTRASALSLARTSTVGKPSKAYKPHQPAPPAGLRVASLLSSLARVSLERNPSKATKATSGPCSRQLHERIELHDSPQDRTLDALPAANVHR